MYINNYIQVFIQFISVILFLTYILHSPTSKNYVSIKMWLGILVGVVILGLSLSWNLGHIYGKSVHEINLDVSRIIVFPLTLMVPFLYIMLPRKIKYMIRQVVFVFAFMYTLLVFGNLLAGAPKGQSIYPGNMFRSSTVNLTLISSWSFWGINEYFVAGRKVSRLLYTIMAWLCCFMSLAKWNIVVILFIPFLLIYLLIFKNDRFDKPLKSFVKGVTIFLVVAFIANGTFFLDRFAANAGYDDITQYVNSRVLRDTEKNIHIDKAAISIGNGRGIKDGGRLLVWGDLITRTIDAPLTGIGLGARGLERIGFAMEDHNIFITFLSRFGIPLSILWLISSGLVFIKYHKLAKNATFKYTSLIFIACLANYIFQASVGNTWGQFLIGIFLGLSWGMMIDTYKAELTRRTQKFPSY